MTPSEWEDETFSRLAIAQACLARPHPNPQVGAVVVQAGRLVAVGHHERAGLSHAETIALQKAGARAQGGTLYVTLEPCNHHGRTPPCVDAIVDAAIRRVVIACPDPNPLVRGGGATFLRARGIEVVWGPGRREVEELLGHWFATLPFSDGRRAGAG